jgi:hypothetical protein
LLKPAEILDCPLWAVSACGEFVANPAQEKMGLFIG